MMLLTKDQELFERKFHEANVFLNAARLRRECYGLAVKKDRNEWEAHRLGELLKNAPACREPWFIVQLRGDCDQNVENLLLEIGY